MRNRCQPTATRYIRRAKRRSDTEYGDDVPSARSAPWLRTRVPGVASHRVCADDRSSIPTTGNELVYDLYTGTGTIAQFVAKKARKVVGVEAVKEAIDDAKVNAVNNNINNVVFYVGDMKNVFNEDFIAKNGTPDVIITDPPRDGMHKDVVQQILNVAPDRIVYVSCNSATQARDLALMDSLYKVIKVQPVDMFPQTHHVENVVLLEKRK